MPLRSRRDERRIFMILDIDAGKLEAFLKSDSDCEEISAGEYVADFYDIETPITVNISVKGGKVDCEAAAYLKYDEEQDGWYMGERIENAGEIVKIILQAMDA